MNILMPIYSCNPESESEALVGFKWLSQISKQHKVFLITAAKYKDTLAKQINQNVIPHYVEVPEFGNLQVLSGLAPGYFVFMSKAFLAARHIIKTQKIDLIHRVTPIAFRFPDLFVTLPIPCLIGPVGGGLKPLAAFPSVFKKESLVYRLRQLDGLRFRCDPWLIHTYDKASRILVTCKYLYDIIPQRYHHKLLLQTEATINTKEYAYKLKRDNAVLKILYVGRFIPLKAVNLLIRALHEIEQERPRFDFQATFIGDGGEYYQQCQDLVKSFGLENKVVFKGRLKRAQIIEYYHDHDIFCFPSLKDTSGNVVLEAMGCGIPVIVADRGGPAEIVGPDCGIKIAVRDETDFTLRLKAGIVRLFENKELRYRYAINARRRIEEYYDDDSIGARIFSVYAELKR